MCRITRFVLRSISRAILVDRDLDFVSQLRTEEEKDVVDKRLLKRQEQRKRKLKEVGIDYDFDMVAYVRWCFAVPCSTEHSLGVTEKETTDE